MEAAEVEARQNIWWRAPLMYIARRLICIVIAQKKRSEATYGLDVGQNGEREDTGMDMDVPRPRHIALAATATDAPVANSSPSRRNVNNEPTQRFFLLSVLVVFDHQKLPFLYGYLFSPHFIPLLHFFTLFLPFLNLVLPF